VVSWYFGDFLGVLRFLVVGYIIWLFCSLFGCVLCVSFKSWLFGWLLCLGVLLVLVFLIIVLVVFYYLLVVCLGVCFASFRVNCVWFFIVLLFYLG